VFIFSAVFRELCFVPRCHGEAPGYLLPLCYTLRNINLQGAALRFKPSRRFSIPLLPTVIPPRQPRSLNCLRATTSSSSEKATPPPQPNIRRPRAILIGGNACVITHVLNESRYRARRVLDGEVRRRGLYCQAQCTRRALCAYNRREDRRVESDGAARVADSSELVDVLCAPGFEGDGATT